MSLNIATELVAHVAAYLSGREAGAPGGGSYWGRGKKSELLALRVASKHCRDAVRRAVKTHASCEVISLAPVDSDGYSDGTYYRPECVAAAGRVFGAGCREVYFQGNTVALESAFEEFVKNTEGRLRILRVGDTLDRTIMCPASYLNICGACPLLRELKLASRIAGRPIRELAAEIGAHASTTSRETCASTKHEIRTKSDPRISSTATSSTPSTRSGTSSRNAAAAWGS